MKSRELILSFDWSENRLWNKRLGMPVGQGAHYGSGFLVRVNRTVVRVILVLNGGVRIKSSLCKGGEKCD